MELVAILLLYAVTALVLYRALLRFGCVRSASQPIRPERH